ncbi:hypothetical protein GGR56DRAFT_263376 [Xylariaceae sp. FL0804]|nr:hypothetical protein GGR56DRAFT_263376 [Xylariaceae sp. FL0804]
MIKVHQVAILDEDTMCPAGAVMFTCLIATAFPHLQSSQYVDPGPLKRSCIVRLLEHLVLGGNDASRGCLQVGENTKTSFRSAAQLGASQVDLEVQLTKDLGVVNYHDFSAMGRLKSRPVWI